MRKKQAASAVAHDTTTRDVQTGQMDGTSSIVFQLLVACCLCTCFLMCVIAFAVAKKTVVGTASAVGTASVVGQPVKQ